MSREPLVDFGIILTAGGSTRMGTPKALLQWRGDHLINAHIRAFRTVCRHIILVTGRHSAEIKAVVDESLLLIHNEQWETTHMADSLRLALQHCHGTALVTPVDSEPAPIEVLEELCAHGSPVVPQYLGKDGHPVVIHVEAARSFKGHLKALMTDAARLPVDWPGALNSWNTPDEWEAYSDSERN